MILIRLTFRKRVIFLMFLCTEVFPKGTVHIIGVDIENEIENTTRNSVECQYFI
jgi:hypothetical protein